MQTNAFQIILMFVPGILAMAQSDCISRFENKDSVNLLSTQELGSEFERLRRENSSCNKRWGGDFHLIMQQLASRLGTKGTHQEEIMKWMGSPDYRTDSINAVRINVDEEILVYHWRGQHDWLYFIIKDDLVKNCDWWFAYE